MAKDFPSSAIARRASNCRFATFSCMELEYPRTVRENSRFRGRSSYFLSASPLTFFLSAMCSSRLLS